MYYLGLCGFFILIQYFCDFLPWSKERHGWEKKIFPTKKWSPTFRTVILSFFVLAFYLPKILGEF